MERAHSLVVNTQNKTRRQYPQMGKETVKKRSESGVEVNDPLSKKRQKSTIPLKRKEERRRGWGGRSTEPLESRRKHTHTHTHLPNNKKQTKREERAVKGKARVTGRREKGKEKVARTEKCK